MVYQIIRRRKNFAAAMLTQDLNAEIVGLNFIVPEVVRQMLIMHLALCVEFMSTAVNCFASVWNVRLCYRRRARRKWSEGGAEFSV